jgi:hypothetical protein
MAFIILGLTLSAAWTAFLGFGIVELARMAI